MNRFLISAIMMVFATCVTAQDGGSGVKPYTDGLDVVVGGKFAYSTSEDVTYNIRTYEEDGTAKMDVEVPAYTLDSTVIGNLSIGTYTVKGLTYDSEKGGYYRDYKDDGLTMVFSNGDKINGDYTFSVGSILVILKDDLSASIVNTFQPGAMPFPIVSTFPGATATAITGIKDGGAKTAGGTYNLTGLKVTPGARGIVIEGGKKYLR